MIILLMVLILALAVSTADASPKQPVPRKDAYFGLHFDLHPQKTDTSLGADIAEENISHLLDRVKPDYVQYDCKGHGGYTGYPTKVGWPSPGIVKDSLAIWRAVTREHGVQLFIHYSGVWDIVCAEHHPDWARITPDGSVDVNAMSTFGPYVDQLMIPQLREVISAYDLDGVWADGECWAAQLDYSPMAIAAWEKETGLKGAPKDRNDPNWLKWKMFNRSRFEKYVAHWIDEVHKTNPRAQLTSNWMYTTFAALPVTAKLDFLSGDYTPLLSIDRARVEARYLANTGMPWDLMAWGFNNGPSLGQSLKTPIQMKQEAAAVLMQGGGFQIYYNPTRSGYVPEQIVQAAGAAADFCRARQKVSHKSIAVPQVALLLSTETLMDRSDAVFIPHGCTDELEGALHSLLENHYSVDILAEHQLQQRMKEFPLVVLPDCHKLTDDFKNTLLNYVENGGSLLLMGEKSAHIFNDKLGVKFEGQPQNIGAELASSAGISNANGVWQKITPTTAKVIGSRYPSRDTRKNGEPAATVIGYGKGKIGAIYGPVALDYFRSHNPYMRRFVREITSELFSDPAVTIKAPPTVEVSLRRTKSGKLSLHLLNTTGMQLSERHGVIDYIPEVGPINVSMTVPTKPKMVSWVPDGGKLEWTWEDGVLSVTITKLEIHGVVLVD